MSTSKVKPLAKQPRQGDAVRLAAARCFKSQRDRLDDEARQFRLCALLIAVRDEELTNDIATKCLAAVNVEIEYWEKETDVGQPEGEFYELRGALTAWLEGHQVAAPATDVHDMDDRQLEAALRERAEAFLAAEVRDWGDPGDLFELLCAIKLAPHTVNLAHRLHGSLKAELIDFIKDGIVSHPAIDFYDALGAYIGDELKRKAWGGAA